MAKKIINRGTYCTLVGQLDKLARYAGLRIHECFRIDTATAERVLRENAITIKGKGGKVRTVPINEQIAIAMRKQLDRTPQGRNCWCRETPQHQGWQTDPYPQASPAGLSRLIQVIDPAPRRSIM